MRSVSLIFDFVAGISESGSSNLSALTHLKYSSVGNQGLGVYFQMLRVSCLRSASTRLAVGRDRDSRHAAEGTPLALLLLRVSC